MVEQVKAMALVEKAKIEELRNDVTRQREQMIWEQQQQQ